MKTRKKLYGDKNLVGRNIERFRKEQRIRQKDFVAHLQLLGCDITPTSYSKLEGQLRSATDRGILAISRALGVTMEELFK